MGSLTETACAGDDGRTRFFGGHPRPLLGCVGVDIADIASPFVLFGAATFEEDTGAKDRRDSIAESKDSCSF